MKTMILILSIFSSFFLLAEDKEFSSQKTFPFEPGTYKIRGVPAKTIYLTIDDGPVRPTTPMMLDALLEENVKATFFVHGNQARRKSDLLERMYLEGHLVANHTNDHVTDFPSRRSFINSTMDTHRLIERFIANENIFLFRSPGGVWNQWRTDIGNSHPVLRTYVGPFFWNVGGGSSSTIYHDADWKCWSKKGRQAGVTVKSCTESYYRQIVENYQRGQASLVLLHDIKTQSAELLRLLIKKLKTDDIEWEFRLADDIPVVREMAESLND